MSCVMNWSGHIYAFESSGVPGRKDVLYMALRSFTQNTKIIWQLYCAV
jgi:hypothetical protein